jgi:hypothetical protein
MLDEILARRSHEYPDGVTRIGFEFGEDSTGDPAVWISIFVKRDLEPTKETVDAIHDFAQAIRLEIIEARKRHWPYVRIRMDD